MTQSEEREEAAGRHKRAFASVMVPGGWLLLIMPLNIEAFLQQSLQQSLPQQRQQHHPSRLLAKTMIPSAGGTVAVFGPFSGIAGGLTYRFEGSMMAPLVDFSTRSSGDGAPVPSMETIRKALRGASHVVVAPEATNTNPSSKAAFLSQLSQSMVVSKRAGESKIESVIYLEDCGAPSSSSSSGAGASDAKEGGGFYLRGILGGLGGSGGNNEASLHTSRSRDSIKSFDGSVKGLHDACRLLGATCTILKHGRLFGVTTGDDPMPFAEGCGPVKEPKLVEHYAARAVLLSPSDAVLEERNTNPLGRIKVRTNRLTLVELIVRLIERENQDEDVEDTPKVEEGARMMRRQTFTVLSLEGAEPTSDEWGEQFRRLEKQTASTFGMELLRVAFDVRHILSRLKFVLFKFDGGR